MKPNTRVNIYRPISGYFLAGTSLLFVGFVVMAAGAFGQVKPEDRLFGEWTGDSKCVGTNPYCHDEIVVYRFSASRAAPAEVAWAAYKVVDKKLDFMGDLEMSFDREKRTLSGDFRIPRTGGRGVWSLNIKGDEMDGTLTIYPENEVGRKIHVTRKNG